MTSKQTNDALSIIHQEFYANKPERLVALSEARVNDDVARKIREMRESANLSQRKLADLVGTTASVICRLEDSDYEGHSLSMLNRIAHALNKRVKIDFVSNISTEDKAKVSSPQV